MKRILISIVLVISLITTVTPFSVAEAKTKATTKKIVAVKIKKDVVVKKNETTKKNAIEKPAIKQGLQVINGHNVFVYPDGSMTDQDNGAIYKTLAEVPAAEIKPTPAKEQPAIVAPPTPVNIPLNENNVDRYADGVGWIAVKDADGNLLGHGTGWLVKINGESWVYTNMHVIADGSIAELHMETTDLQTHGFYMLDLSQYRYWNKSADFAAIRVKERVSGMPIDYWSHNIQNVNRCGDVSLGSKVYVIGFPSNNVLIENGYYRVYQATTKGVIVKYSSNQYPLLPYVNYEHTAMNAAGDSGGVAFSEDTSGMCYLGIETWGHGPYGIVQNAWNIEYKQNQ